MKIHVTGNAGSGKSTLAAKISEATNIQLFGLDKIVWKDNWVKSSKEERNKAIQHILSNTSWVLEGVSRDARNQADIVVFIDRPRFLCIIRAIRRSIPFLLKSRTGLPNNCPEIKIIPYLVKLIFQFNSSVRPSIMTDIRNKKHFVLKSDKDISDFLQNLEFELYLSGWTQKTKQPI